MVLQLLRALLLGLQLTAGAALHCPGPTYPEGNRCCPECEPGAHAGRGWPGRVCWDGNGVTRAAASGFGMEKRCDSHQDTLCRPCQRGFYSEAFTSKPCQPCTQCHHRE